MNSPVRAFGAVGGARVHGPRPGPYLTDVDGREYVDLVCSWGPMILGHAHPAVVAAVTEALADGTSFGTATPGEVELAEEIVARTPVEKVRLVNSGTEATMSAVRLARGSPAAPWWSSSPAATTAMLTRCSPPRVPASRRSGCPTRPA